MNAPPSDELSGPSLASAEEGEAVSPEGLAVPPAEGVGHGLTSVVTPLRGAERFAALGGFAGLTALTAFGLGSSAYARFVDALGASPQGVSGCVVALSVALALASLLPWLVRAPSALLSWSLFLGFSLTTPLVFVRLSSEGDFLLATLGGACLGGVVGGLYALLLDWDLLFETGIALAVPGALLGIVTLPVLVVTLLPEEVSMLLGVGGVALGGVGGYHVGFALGEFLEAHARKVALALSLTPGAASLGVGLLALRSMLAT